MISKFSVVEFSSYWVPIFRPSSMNWALMLTEIIIINFFLSYVGRCFNRLNTRNNVCPQGLGGGGDSYTAFISGLIISSYPNQLCPGLLMNNPHRDIGEQTHYSRMRPLFSSTLLEIHTSHSKPQGLMTLLHPSCGEQLRTAPQWYC